MSTLPPLPEPHSTRKVWVDGIPSHLFTAEQMFAFRARGLAAQAAEVEALRDELRLCCELKREYQEQVASKVDEVEALRADAALPQWILSHPETCAEELEDACDLLLDPRTCLEQRKAGIEAAARAALKEQAPNAQVTGQPKAGPG